jgi:hypothetical protein
LSVMDCLDGARRQWSGCDAVSGDGEHDRHRDRVGQSVDRGALDVDAPDPPTRVRHNTSPAAMKTNGPVRFRAANQSARSAHPKTTIDRSMRVASFICGATT